MQDPSRHVVIDANVLSAGLLPQSTKNEQVRDRARDLLDAVTQARWPSLVLYTPGICVAEVRGTFDKYRYCTWQGDVKHDPTKKISNDEYAAAEERLQEVEESVAFHRVNHDPKHVLAARLVSPINAHFQDCAQGRNRHARQRLMSATDCVIAGMAIILQLQLGPDSVVLATADHRLADVISKAKTLTRGEADKLGLDFAAVSMGVERWSQDVYPNCVNLIDAKENDLRCAFLGWPLPVKALSEKTARQLKRAERDHLARLWRSVKKEHKLGGEDRLPYSFALDDLRTRFACEAGLYVRNDQIYHVLQNRRKASAQPPEEDDELPLFDE